MRHGARTPILKFEPYKFSIDPGRLTSKGAQQHFNLSSQELRPKYVSTPESKKLLKDEFDPEEVVVFSTNFERTIKSAQAHLLGLFSPNDPIVESTFDKVPSKFNFESEEKFHRSFDSLLNSTEYLKQVTALSIFEDNLLGYLSCDDIRNTYESRLVDGKAFFHRIEPFADLFPKLREVFKGDLNDSSIFQAYDKP
jgi:hypothetical protein